MGRTRLSPFVTGSLSLAALLAMAAPATHAQAPRRSVSGSYYYVAARSPATPSTAIPPAPSATTTARSRASYYYAAPATPARPEGGYYYPAQASAAQPARYYYPAPAARGPSYANPAAPAISRGAPVNFLRSNQPRPRPAVDDEYGYKS